MADSQRTIEILLQIKQVGQQLLKTTIDSLYTLGTPLQQAATSANTVASEATKMVQPLQQAGQAAAEFGARAKQGTDQAKAGIAGFLDATKGSLGRGSVFKEMIELLAGGGVVMAVGLLANEIKRAATEATQLKKDFNEGKISAAEFRFGLIETIPLIGQIAGAERAVRELFTGEQAEIAKINEEAKRTDEIFKSQVATAKSLKKVLEEVYLEQKRVETARLNMDADPFTREMNNLKLAVLERNKARADAAKAALDEIVDKTQPGLGAKRTAWEAADNAFAQAFPGLDWRTVYAKRPDILGLTPDQQRTIAAKADSGSAQWAKTLKMAMDAKAAFEDYDRALRSLGSQKKQVTSVYGGLTKEDEKKDAADQEQLLRHKFDSESQLAEELERKAIDRDAELIRDRQAMKIAAMEAAGDKDAAAIQAIQDRVANQTRENDTKLEREIADRFSKAQADNLFKDPKFVESFNEWVASAREQTKAVNDQAAASGGAEIDKIKADAKKRLIEITKVPGDVLKQQIDDWQRAAVAIGMSAEEIEKGVAKLQQMATEKVVPLTAVEQIQKSIDEVQSAIDRGVGDQTKEQNYLAKLHHDLEAQKVQDTDAAIAAIAQGYEKMVAQNKVQYDQDYANWQAKHDLGLMSNEQWQEKQKQLAEQLTSANAQALDQMRIEHDQFIVSVETGTRRQIDEANIQYQQDVANFREALAKKKISLDEYQQLVDQAGKIYQEKLKQVDFARQQAGRNVDLLILQANHQPQQAKLLQIDIELAGLREQLRRDFEVEGLIDEEQYNEALVALDKQAAERRLEIQGNFIDGMKLGFQKLQDAELTTAQVGMRVADEIADGFADAFSSAIMGTKSFAEAFRGMIYSILADLAKLYAKQAIVRLFSSLGGGGGGGAGGGGFDLGGLFSGVGSLLGGLFGANKGGLVPGFAVGGFVNGGGPDRDSILAGLTPGEFVINRRAVQQPGILSILQAINAGMPAYTLQPALTATAGASSGANAGKQVITAVVPIGDTEIERISAHPNFRAAVRQEVARNRDTLMA